MLIAILALAACGSEKSESPTPPGRVVAVKAKKQVVESTADFCDVEDKTGAKKLTLPELDSAFSPKPNAPRWVNVWATWCKPCIAEMPMLAKWQDRMKAEGVAMNLEFLSVDEDMVALGAFMKTNTYLKTNLHLKDPETLAPWLEQLGLDKGAGLPIHIFTDVQSNIRCVRAAAISETHYPTIFGLLKPF